MDLDIIEKQTQLVGGQNGIDNVITYVTIMEAPDFHHWVTGGEFVVTTWYAFKDHPELQIEAFTELAKRGIAALGIKVNRFLDRIPDAIVKVANQYRIPLFSISRETKFREIIQAISTELSNYQVNILMEVDKHYKALTRTVLNGGDISALLKDIAIRKKCHVFCLGADLKLIGYYSPFSHLHFPMEKVELLKAHIQANGHVLSYTRFQDLHIFPCLALGHSLGYFALCDPLPLDDKINLMANQLTTFLALKMMDTFETEQKMLAALLDDILFRHVLTEEEIKDKLEILGLKRADGYRVTVLRALHSGSIENVARLRQYGTRLRSCFESALLILRPDEAIVISKVSIAEVLESAVLKRTLHALIQDVEAELVAGVGPVVYRAKEIEQSYRTTRQTIKAGLATQQRGILYYSDYLARLLVFRAAGTPEQDYLLQAVIKPLEAVDQKYDSGLMETLGAALFADELDAVASQLHVHINTVRYRLRRIETLTGLNFLSAKGRYVLTTAYLLYCYSQIL